VVGVLANHQKFLPNFINQKKSKAGTLSVVGVPANHQINWAVLNKYRATQTDRKFHFWERRPRSIQVLSYAIAMQKLEYIHRNPCHEKWSLTAEAISYKYSSAAFYEKELDHFGFLTHISEMI
jgi:hypothetical protein